MGKRCYEPCVAKELILCYFEPREVLEGIRLDEELVLKTGGSNPLGVRVPHPPQVIIKIKQKGML